jgi:hypothetical protein
MNRRLKLHHVVEDCALPTRHSKPQQGQLTLLGNDEQALTTKLKDENQDYVLFATFYETNLPYLGMDDQTTYLMVVILKKRLNASIGTKNNALCELRHTVVLPF